MYVYTYILICIYTYLYVYTGPDDVRRHDVLNVLGQEAGVGIFSVFVIIDCVSLYLMLYVVTCSV